MTNFMKNHRGLTLLLLIIISPIVSALLGVIIAVGWIIGCLFNFFMWPFKVLTGAVFTILGGGVGK